MLAQRDAARARLSEMLAQRDAARAQRDAALTQPCEVDHCQSAALSQPREDDEDNRQSAALSQPCEEDDPQSSSHAQRIANRASCGAPLGPADASAIVVAVVQEMQRTFPISIDIEKFMAAVLRESRTLLYGPPQGSKTSCGICPLWLWTMLMHRPFFVMVCNTIGSTRDLPDKMAKFMAAALEILEKNGWAALIMNVSRHFRVSTFPLTSEWHESQVSPIADGVLLFAGTPGGRPERLR
jgi:hypothetical protein